MSTLQKINDLLEATETKVRLVSISNKDDHKETVVSGNSVSEIVSALKTSHKDINKFVAFFKDPKSSEIVRVKNGKASYLNQLFKIR